MSDDRFVLWPVDSLVKVMRAAAPASRDEAIRFEACRNEYTSAQCVLTATAPLGSVRVSLSPLRHAEGGGAEIEGQARFVGYVPVRANTPDTERDELDCMAPCLVPDPLLEKESVSVAIGQNQPIWLTFFIPPNARPGTWVGTVQVEVDGERGEMPISLTVHPATLPPSQHLWVTNWMNTGNYARHFGTELYSPRFWQVVDRFARNVGAHRQNVIEAPQSLVQIYLGEEGRLSFDFAQWDRWVDTFDRYGAAKLIEGGSVARRGDGKWENPWFDWLKLKVTRRTDGQQVDLDPVTVIEQLLKAVAAHLRQRGLLDRYLQHVVDEPAPHTEEDYKKKSALVHEWMPGVRYLEAMSCTDMRGYLDIWVPNVDHFDEAWPNYFEMRQQSGCELWFYTCMFPTGRYPNRFLDFSLLKTRILHWLNWRYQITGYLHWGLNFWTDKPFSDDRIRESLPPGDCWIVYPGANGPLDSLRWEQMREGLQDFELLWLLGQKDRRRADAICARLAPHPLTYARDWRHLRSARREVIDALLA